MPSIHIPPLFLPSPTPPPSSTLALHRHNHTNLRILTFESLFRPNRGYEIDSETPDIESINKGHDPFQHRSRIQPTFTITDTESDGETNFHNDEGEFYPEGETEDAVLTVVDAETLIFPTDEDCRDDVTTAMICISSIPTYLTNNKQHPWWRSQKDLHENPQTNIMRRMVMNIIQTR